MDSSILHIYSRILDEIHVYDLEGFCEECSPLFRGVIFPGEVLDLQLTTVTSHSLQIYSKLRTRNNISLCSKDFTPAEYGEYEMIVADRGNQLFCSDIKLEKYSKYFSATPVVPVPLIVIFSVFLLLYFLPSLVRFIYFFLNSKKYVPNCLWFFLKWKTTPSIIYYRKEDFQPDVKINTEKYEDRQLDEKVINLKEFEMPRTQSLQKKDRIMSLDTFRGLTVTLMMFINAGGGGYWIFSHAVWSGITFADIPHPWFNWIMGVSIVFGRASTMTTYERFKRIFERVAKLFLVGYTMSSVAFTMDLNHIPALGVTQDLALLYLVAVLLYIYAPRPSRASIVQLQQTCTKDIFRGCLPFREFRAFWPFLTAAALGGFLNIMFAFGINVPGCGRGYFGPGGARLRNKNFKNCTGGAFSYIDYKLIGPNHLTFGLLFQRIYDTDQQHDSYGVAGLPSQFTQVMLGVLTGEILLLYKHLPSIVIQKWLGTTIIWVILTLFFCNPFYCVFPLNRRIWSLSCIFFTSSVATAFLTVLYFLVDVKKIWSGTPFYYPGANSIAMFVGQYVLRKIFPFSWNTPKTHIHLTFMHLWQTFLWILISIYMYKKKIFIRM